MTTRGSILRTWRALAAVLLFTVNGCGGPAVNQARSLPGCVTHHPASQPADTLTVVVFDKIDLAHAPWGRNREERFVFGHLYETLVTIDCHGKIQPGLAKSWLRASDGWLIELREDAHFWDGMPVTAKDVAVCLDPAIRQGVVIDQIDVVDERRLLVHTDHAEAVIKLLADPFLAISSAGRSPGMPMGTGRWRIDEDRPADRPVVMFPVVEETPAVRFVRGKVRDARDIMDGTADAMITDDPAAIEYARGRTGTALAPLVWDHAYVFVSTSRSRRLDEGKLTDDLEKSVCDELARDAVSIDARGGSSLLAESMQVCLLGMNCVGIQNADAPPQKPPAISHRIVYVAGDSTARHLAERIVGLAAMDTTVSSQAHALATAVPDLSSDLRAVSLSEPAFSFSLRMGNEFGYVLPLSWNADFPCVVSRFDQCCWLFSIRGRLLTEVMVPLVETRAHFVATSGRIGFIDDGAGNVRITIPPPGARY